MKIGNLTLNGNIFPSACSDVIHGPDLYKELGAVFTKTITLEKRAGNQGKVFTKINNNVSINRLGLPNNGPIDYVYNVLPKLPDVPIFTSIYGESLEEYKQIIEILNEFDKIKGIEVNLSCPNVDHNFYEYNYISGLIESIKQLTDKTLVVKLPPNPDMITTLAKACKAGGADAITATNTIKALVVDNPSPNPTGWTINSPYDIVVGGMSGEYLKPISLRCVYEIANIPGWDLPIIGCGGIRNIKDVEDYMRVGASAVQIGLAALEDPDMLVRLNSEWISNEQHTNS